MSRRPTKTNSRLKILILLPVLASCGPVHQAIRAAPEDIGNVKRLAVVVPNDGSFTVLLDRATATTAPAVLFGLIGAAVAAAHNTSLDNDKMTSLGPQLTDFSARAIFVESFSKTLKDSGRLSEWQMFDKAPEGNEVERFDAVLTMNIKNWGLRLPAREEEKLAGFIELETKMSRIKDGQMLWDEHDTFIGQRRHYFSEYKDDGNMFRSEIKETIQNAGLRMATRIAFPRRRTD